MKFYISFKDSRDNVFKTIRIWTSETDIESVLRQFAENSFSKEFVESVKFEAENKIFLLSLFGQNKIEIGSVTARVAA